MLKSGVPSCSFKEDRKLKKKKVQDCEVEAKEILDKIEWCLEHFFKSTESIVNRSMKK